MSRYLLPICVTFILLGCSYGGGSYEESLHESAPQTASARSLAQTSNADSTQKITQVIDNQIQHHRKIIYIADVSILVEEFARAEKEIPRLVKEYGGYLGNVAVNRSRGDTRLGNWTARIPVDNYNDFLTALEGLGVPENLSQKAQDVTEEYADLEARIVNSKRLEERILKLLDEPKGKIKDIIVVEHELARVREAIERMQGRLNYLTNRTELTTVKITVRERLEYVPAQAPIFSVRIVQAWTESWTALRVLGESLTIAFVAIIPWTIALIPIALLAWVILRYRDRFRRQTTPA